MNKHFLFNKTNDEQWQGRELRFQNGDCGEEAGILNVKFALTAL
jgi:hypothetical protein